MTAMLSLLLLAGCGAERGQRAFSEEVSFAGWVYESPSSTEAEAVLADATLTFDVAGALVAAEQPYEDYPGYWAVALPSAAPFTLRIEGEGLYPSVWAGDAPRSDGSWFSGALFGAEQGFLDDWLTTLAEGTGLSIGPLGGDNSHVWGYPLDGSVWDCAAVRVADERVHCFAVQEDGTLAEVTEGPLDYFFAFDLPPGDIVVDSGLGAVEVYPTTGGELVWAFWLATEQDG